MLGKYGNSKVHEARSRLEEGSSCGRRERDRRVFRSQGAPKSVAMANSAAERAGSVGGRLDSWSCKGSCGLSKLQAGREMCELLI